MTLFAVDQGRTTTRPRPIALDANKRTDVSVTDSSDRVYLSPQDNEIADSANAKNNLLPNVNEPKNKVESDDQESPKLNLGK